MKKFLLRCLYLFITVWVCQYSLYLTLRLCVDDHSQFRCNRFFRQPVHKYFIVGNSRASNTINEKLAREQLKVDVINLGLNGITAEYLFPLIEEVNRHNKNAELFIEITAFDAPLKINQDYAYFISYSNAFRDIIDKKEFDLFPLLRFNSIFFLRSLYFLNKSDADAINSRIISAQKGKDVENGNEIPLINDKKKFFAAIDSVSKICKAHNNKAHFFLAPYYPPSLKRFYDYAEVIDSFNKKHYYFTDLNTNNLQNNMFSDRIHTNIYGANAITIELFQNLQHLE